MLQKRLSKMYRGLAVFMAAGLILNGQIPLSASSDTKQQLEEAQQNANRVSSEIDENKEDLNALEQEKNQISGQLNSYNQQLQEAVQALNNTESAITAKQSEIEEKMRQLEAAKTVEETQRTALLEHIQFMYESGVTQSYLNLLSEVTSLTDFLNLSEYVEQVSAYDMRMLDQFKETRQYIEQEEAQLEQERENLETLRTSQQQKRNEVNHLVDQTQSALSYKKGEISQKENEVTAQEEELAKIQDNIEELQKKLAEEIALSQAAAKAEWRDISEVTFEEDDVKLLANLIYCEARGESYDGKLAVASVVVNRILSSKFPNSMAGVIYQTNQFEPVASTRNSFVEALAYDKAANVDGCYQAAQEAMSGITNVTNCVFFQTIAYLEKVERLDVVRYTIGNHGFY